MMDEFGFPQDDIFTEFDRYIIGFTENQYSKSKDKSPSPVDQTPRHSSLALEYAERSNKVAENIFQDRRISLDREKTRSMSKINGNMLDLVFELTERRKTSNPLVRSLTSTDFSDYPRPDSGLSNTSVEYRYDAAPSSPTFPTIQVQQLPPLYQPRDNLLPILPDIYIDPVNVPTKPKKKKKKTVEPLSSSSLVNGHYKKETSVVKTPKLVSIVKEYHSKQKLANKSVPNQEDTESTTPNNQSSEHVDPPATDTSHDEETPTITESKFAKWQKVTNKLVVTFQQIRESPEDFNVYSRRKSMSRSSNGQFRKSSFCQSSYQERADKERSNNIRRRHSLQTKTGPLDFNKLRRQISFGRSQTVIW